jgi:hypothetical protein
MALLKAFLLGMREYRSSFTYSYDDESPIVAYDWGREWAHRLTFRRYDN